MKINQERGYTFVEVIGVLGIAGMLMASMSMLVSGMFDKYKNVVPHGKKSRRQCSNDEGGIIDTCMLRLKQYRIDDYELIIAHFVMGVSLRCLAKINECSDGKIRKKMQMAMGFIAGCIYYR